MLQKLSTVVAVAGAIALGAAYSAHAAPAGVPTVRGVAADSVTGCLKKGDKKDVYSVTDASGKKHWVTSSTVALAGHVGHTVTVSGAAPMDNKNGQRHVNENVGRRHGPDERDVHDHGKRQL